MAIELLQNPVGVLTAIGAIGQFRFVKKSVTTAFAVDQAGVGDIALGINQEVTAALGVPNFTQAGISKLTAGGTVAVGDNLVPDATGRGVKQTSTLGNAPVAAIALEAGAVNNIITVLIIPARTADGVQGIAAGYRLARGQQTTVAASDTVVTGLALVVAVVASLDSDPVDDPFMCTASIGDQAGTPAAGSVLIKTWKNTGGTDPTPVAATTFGKKVNWVAVGT